MRAGTMLPPRRVQNRLSPVPAPRMGAVSLAAAEDRQTACADRRGYLSTNVREVCTSGRNELWMGQ
mgnify:CR=1 FL=1